MSYYSSSFQSREDFNIHKQLKVQFRLYNYFVLLKVRRHKKKVLRHLSCCSLNIVLKLIGLQISNYKKIEIQLSVQKVSLKKYRLSLLLKLFSADNNLPIFVNGYNFQFLVY